MKTITSALKAHIGGRLTTLATCLRITTRRGEAYYLTDHDQDLTVSGNTYRAGAGYERSAIGSGISLEPKDLDLDGFFSAHGIPFNDETRGLLDNGRVKIFAVNWQNIGMGTLNLFDGFVGEIERNPSGRYKARLVSLKDKFKIEVGEKFQPECRAHLGDSRCRFPLYPETVMRNKPYGRGEFVKVLNSPACTLTAAFTDNFNTNLNDWTVTNPGSGSDFTRVVSNFPGRTPNNNYPLH